MATTPTEPARVLDEDHRGRTEWRVERMRVHPARDPATIRAPRGQTRWPVYAAIAAVVVALLSLVATAATLWLK
jgi:hypothetical protein